MTVASIAAWAGLIAIGGVAIAVSIPGRAITRHNAIPLHASVDPRVRVWVAIPIALGVVVAIWGERAARSLPWRRLLGLVWVAAGLWAVGLASIRGWQRLANVFARDGEYLAVLPRISSVGGFLGSFVDDIADLPTHVQGHPPGFALLARLFEQVGLGGPLAISLACVAAGAAAAPLVLITLREVAGEMWARRAAPFVVVAPAAIWVATSADALYAGVGGLAVALVVLATGRRDRQGDACALAGGACFGVAAFLSYGLVLLATVPVVIAIQRGRLRPLILAAVGAVPWFVGFGLAGFWWLDGFGATRERYFAGIASHRPYGAYLVGDLAVLAIALGPAIAVAFGRLRDARMWLLVGSAMAAVAIADLSGMSKAEVERIWLPFMPALLVAGAALIPVRTCDGGGDATRSPSIRTTPSAWVALQAGFAICLEMVIRTAW